MRPGPGGHVPRAGSAPSLGQHLRVADRPPETAKVGTKLAVDYCEERYPVTVAAADATPLFDADNERIRS